MSFDNRTVILNALQVDKGVQYRKFNKSLICWNIFWDMCIFSYYLHYYKKIQKFCCKTCHIGFKVAVLHLSLNEGLALTKFRFQTNQFYTSETLEN